MKVFDTDGASVTGTATDNLTGLSFWRPLTDVLLTDLVQPSSATVANDADWTVYANGKQTDYQFQAEMLDPTNKLGVSVVKDGIRIKAGTEVQFKWAGQAVATANKLYVYYQ